MIVKILLVDALTDGLFSGGTAAVAVLRHLGQEVFLQALADEMGFPATVYVLPNQDEFITRAFAPGQGEVGGDSFAALASAHTVYTLGLAPPDRPVTLHGRGGPLRLFRHPTHPEYGVSLALGVAKTSPAASNLTDRLRNFMGLSPDNVAKAEFLGADHLVVCCRSLEAMESCNFNQIASVAPNTRLTISAPLESGQAPGYALRSFSADGVLERAPMSLAVHSILGPYWLSALKKERLEAHYISPRTSRLWVELDDQNNPFITGQTSTLLRADPVLKELTATEDEADMLF